MKIILNTKRYLYGIKRSQKIIAIILITAALTIAGGITAKNVYVADALEQESKLARVLSVSSSTTPEMPAGSPDTTQTSTEIGSDADSSSIPTQSPTPTPTTSGAGGAVNTPAQTDESNPETFDVNLTVIGLLDGDANCRETKVTTNKTITDYTYISGSDVSGGGSPQSKSFIFGICKKAGAYDYYLTLYSSSGGKKVVHEFFSSWPSADSFPTPAPTETPQHEAFNAEWVVEGKVGELKTLYCIEDKCTKSDKYQQVTITANIQLKSCLVSTNGYSSPGGGISVNNNGNHEGKVENNICSHSTSIGYTIKGVKIESIYGEIMTFGDW